MLLEKQYETNLMIFSALQADCCGMIADLLAA
jgi:hypothetical protein